MKSSLNRCAKLDFAKLLEINGGYSSSSGGSSNYSCGAPSTTYSTPHYSVTSSNPAGSWHPVNKISSCGITCSTYKQKTWF